MDIWLDPQLAAGHHILFQCGDLLPFPYGVGGQSEIVFQKLLICMLPDDDRLADLAAVRIPRRRVDGCVVYDDRDVVPCETDVTPYVMEAEGTRHTV